MQSGFAHGIPVRRSETESLQCGIDIIRDFRASRLVPAQQLAANHEN